MARWHADLVEVSCALYLVGGATRDASSPRVLSLPDVMLYHDAEDFWETITTLDRPRHDAGVAALGKIMFSKCKSGNNSLSIITLDQSFHVYGNH